MCFSWEGGGRHGDPQMTNPSWGLCHCGGRPSETSPPTSSSTEVVRAPPPGGVGYIEKGVLTPSPSSSGGATPRRLHRAIQRTGSCDPSAT
eukprot:9494580-Alexandrium_andersonii.AAC.1